MASAARRRHSEILGFKHLTSAAFLGLLAATSAAADGRIIITQERGLAGHITAGDAPGFPIQLTEPGSYVLESNLSVPAGKNGITVTASNVAIDLNNFLIDGEGRNALNGIYVPGSEVLNLSVENGTIAEFRTNGVQASRVSFINLHDLSIFGNGSDGLRLFANVTVRESNIFANLGAGISCDKYCHIESNNITANAKEGVSVIDGNVVNNSIFYNGGRGIRAVEVAGAGGNMLVGNGGQLERVLPLNPNACESECNYLQAFPEEP